MIKIYNQEQQEKVIAGGKITGEVMRRVLAHAKVGMTTMELDAYAEEQMLALGAQPSFKMEKGYHFATCMCVNDVVVHGLPTKIPLAEGDALAVDLGCFYEGFHTDASWSVVMGSGEYKETKQFLDVGEEALRKAIEACRVGNHIGDISKALQDTIEGAGYRSVRQLVGHGVGQMLHEDPEIPCYVRGKRERTPKIEAGMILALEAIYNQGESPVVYSGEDDWTIVTKDGSLSGLFEHTVIVTPKGAKVVTA